LRTGCPAEAAKQRRRANADAGFSGASAVTYVHILQSIDGEDFYVGATTDLKERFEAHNAGQVSHTRKYRPWRLRTYMAFSDADQAWAFERYLKSSSGRAFQKRHF
jgi:putative endonuclease